VAALARQQVAGGHNVRILTTDQGERSGEEPLVVAGVDVERLAVIGPDRPAWSPGFPMAVRRRLGDTDVVHIHSLFTYPVHAALRECLRTRTPTVLRPCGMLHPYSLRRSGFAKSVYLRLWGSLVRQACSAWHHTSTNEAEASWPGGEMPGFVLANGVDPTSFEMDLPRARGIAARLHPDLEANPFVLYLGRIHPKKRLDLLLESFADATPANWRLAVVGPDECGLWPELFARHLGVPSQAARVIRLETVQGEEKTALLAAAEYFALPSEHENFGNAALEALAAGTPVLLSPNVDLTEAVGDAGDAILGRTVPSTTIAWRMALSEASANSGKTPGQVAARRAWVRANFSWSHINERLIGHYQKLVRS